MIEESAAFSTRRRSTSFLAEQMADKRRRHGSSNRGQSGMYSGQREQSMSISNNPPDTMEHSAVATTTSNGLSSGTPQQSALSSSMSRSQSPLVSQNHTAGHSPSKSAQKVTSPKEQFARPPIPTKSGALGQQTSTQPRPPSSKVAIPRIRRNSEVTISSAGADKHRVSHACEPCRHRKVKCSGERPTCTHCRDFDIVCVYGDGKRDKFKRDYARLITRNENYEKLLKELSSRVGSEDQASIRKLIESQSTGMGESPQASKLLKRARRESNESSSDEQKCGEKEVEAGVGSEESGDALDEDINKTEETRATGYIGQNSEISWLRRLKKEVADGNMNQDSRPAAPYGPPGNSDEAAAARREQARKRHEQEGAGAPITASDATYHCDDMNVLLQDQVDPYQIPPKETAERLFQCYLESVHDEFPILGKNTFTGQFKKYFQGLQDGSPVRLPYKWRAILNFIFAIGAKYSHLTKAEWRGDDRDHLVYFTRGRMLGLHGDSIVSHPDLQQVQIVALLAFYFTSINQVSRAWLMSGHAVRCALSLGLNLRNEDPKIGLVSKEVRVRVWWAVQTLERLLGCMTGRRTSIVDDDCTVPLPLPFDEDQLSASIGRIRIEDWHVENSAARDRDRSHDSYASASSNSQSDRQPSASGLPANQSMFGLPTDQPLPAPNLAMFFRFQVQLDLIRQAVVSTLYSAGTMRKSWADVQMLIQDLDSKLQAWKSGLPAIYDFSSSQEEQQFRREKMTLAFAYWSTKVLVSRPCVCRIDRRIRNQSEPSKEFNNTWAKNCVHAAESMLDMLPHKPDPVELYRLVPWWCVLHYLMQAATVLMLELSFEAYHMPEELSHIMKSVVKVVNWLQKMSEDSIAAERAWKICIDTLLKVAAKVDIDLSGVVLSTDGSNNNNLMDIDFDISVPSSPFKNRGPQQTQQNDQANDRGQEFKHHSHAYYGGPTHGSPDHCQYPLYTSYDQFLPFVQTAGASSQQPEQNGMFAPSNQWHMQDSTQPFSPAASLPSQDGLVRTVDDWMKFLHSPAASTHNAS